MQTWLMAPLILHIMWFAEMFNDDKFDVPTSVCFESRNSNSASNQGWHPPSLGKQQTLLRFKLDTLYITTLCTITLAIWLVIENYQNFVTLFIVNHMNCFYICCKYGRRLSDSIICNRK